MLGQYLKCGTVVTLPDVGLAELTAAAVDFVWIDLEHGAMGVGDVLPLAVAARAGGASAFARLGGVDDPALGPVLDAGVDGVVVPRVETAADAERVVGRLRHPPRGTRGHAIRRASGYGGGPAGAAAEPLCVVQIETRPALAGCEAIAAVDGVDALVVGCADLAAALGGGAAELRAAVATVCRAAAEAGIAAGVAGPDDPELLLELAGGEATLLVLGADVRIFARALEVAIGRLRPAPALYAPDRKESHVSA